MDPSSSVSTPPTRKKRPAQQTRLEQSAPRKTRKTTTKGRSRKSRQQVESDEAFSVTDIIHEKLFDNIRYFLIVWAGNDPSTGQAWEHTYEPLTEIGDDLLRGWELKKGEIYTSTDPQAATRTIHYYLRLAGITTEEYKKQETAGTLENSIRAKDSPCYRKHKRRPVPLALSSSNFADFNSSLNASQQIASSSRPQISSLSSEHSVFALQCNSLSGAEAEAEGLEQQVEDDFVVPLPDPPRTNSTHEISVKSGSNESGSVRVVVDPPPAGFDPSDYRLVTESQLQNASFVQTQSNHSSGRVIADSQSLGGSLNTEVSLHNSASKSLSGFQSPPLSVVSDKIPNYTQEASLQHPISPQSPTNNLRAFQQSEIIDLTSPVGNLGRSQRSSLADINSPISVQSSSSSAPPRRHFRSPPVADTTYFNSDSFEFSPVEEEETEEEGGFQASTCDRISATSPVLGTRSPLRQLHQSVHGSFINHQRPPQLSWENFPRYSTDRSEREPSLVSPPFEPASPAYSIDGPSRVRHRSSCNCNCSSSASVGEFESQVPFVPSQALQDRSSAELRRDDEDAIAARRLLQSLGVSSNTSIVYASAINPSNTNSLSVGTNLPNTFSTLPRAPSLGSSLISNIARENLTTNIAGHSSRSHTMESGGNPSSLLGANRDEGNSNAAAPSINMSSNTITEPSLSYLVANTPASAPSVGRKRSFSASSQDSSNSQSIKRARRSEEPEAASSTFPEAAPEHIPAGGEEQLQNQLSTMRVEILENQLKAERQLRTELEKDLGLLQTRFEIQSADHLVLQTELSKTKTALEESKSRATRHLTDLQELRGERSSLRTELEGARQALRESKVPELENLADLTKNAERATQLEKRLELMQGDLAYTQEKYQSASAAAQSNSEEAEILRAENEELKRKASGESARLRALFQDKTNHQLMEELEKAKAEITQLERSLRVAGEEEKRLLEKLDREERRAGMSLNTRSSSPGAIGGRGFGQLSTASAASSRAASPAAGGGGASRAGTFKTSPLQNTLNVEDHE